MAYTYSKAFDMADNIYAVVTDTYNPKYNWQLAGFNQTHNLIIHLGLQTADRKARNVHGWGRLWAAG